MKVGITDLFPAVWHPTVAAAAPRGWSYELAPDLSEETRMRVVQDADAVFCGSAVPTVRMLAAARRLRLVQKLGAGFDNLDLEFCRAKGIAVARLPGNNAIAVAEHAIALMLAVYRGITEGDRFVREGGWGKEPARGRNREIRGKTVGIVGLGHIGRVLAERLIPFGVRLLYYDVRRASGVETTLAVQYVPLEELLRCSDIVTLHLPLNAQTRHMIDRDRLRTMKRDAVLINCARGDLIDEPALIESLRQGRLFGAGLDCFAEERPGGSEAFWQTPNVVLSAHVAGVSDENFETMMQRAFSNAQRYFAGEPLPLEDVVWVPPQLGAESQG